MKFTQVNKEQTKQASEAIEIIVKIKRNLAEQRLTNKAFGKEAFGYELKLVNVSYR